MYQLNLYIYKSQYCVIIIANIARNIKWITIYCDYEVAGAYKIKMSRELRIK